MTTPAIAGSHRKSEDGELGTFWSSPEAPGDSVCPGGGGLLIMFYQVPLGIASNFYSSSGLAKTRLTSKWHLPPIVTGGLSYTPRDALYLLPQPK